MEKNPKSAARRREVSGSCHCGDVRITVPLQPRSVTDCNCSICRRYGTLWAYYPHASVRLEAAKKAIAEYRWGDQTLRFARCRRCGCVLLWERLKPTASSRSGVNMRNFEPALVEGLRLRHFDGAASWTYLD